MPKQPLRNMDLAALSVAFDRAEEDGVTVEVPAPTQSPADCVYLKYVGDKQSVAFDRAEEDGVTVEVPAPTQSPADCVYLKYVGDKQAELFAKRLPHVVVKVLMPSDEGDDTRSREVNVYSKKVIQHVLGFLLTPEEIYRCTRPLNTVRRSGWSLVS